MKIGVLGTGSVGRTLASAFAGLGHGVYVGTRDPDATMARTGSDNFGNPPFKDWIAEHKGIQFGTLAQGAAHGEVVVNATKGTESVAALTSAGKENLAGRIILDVANPLDFSRGMPPSLTVCNTDSLGEQIQRAFPAAKVVKVLNTVTAAVMVEPQLVANGNHTLFLCGDDGHAKEQVTELLQGLGWDDILDLGDITNARATEMYLPLWTRLYAAMGSAMFNVKVVR